MTTQDTLSGTLFAGRYRIARKLGGGGMADVYLAEDQELGRRVAVKMLHARYANDEQFVERFRREATHAAGLSHPNIVSIFDRGEYDGSYYIVMEYVEGRDAQGADPLAWPLSGSGRDRVHAPDPRGAALRAPKRRHPSRHQAAQRHRRSRGRRQGDGLRHRPGRREPDDGRGRDHRHRAVPLTRAGPRRAGRPDVGSVLDRDRALRAPHRRGAVHRRQPGRDRDEAPRRDTARAVRPALGRARRPRPRRRARTRQGARRSLPVGCRIRRRSRDGRARRTRRGRDRGGRDHGARRRARPRRDRSHADRPQAAATAVRAAEARTSAVALVPRHRHRPRRARPGLALLRLDSAAASRRGDRGCPLRRRPPAGECGQQDRGEGPHAPGASGVQLGRGGRRRLQPEPDGRHARRQGDRRHDRRLLGQTGGHDPERRRTDGRRRGR